MQSYTFLRDVEHKLQMVHDLQTHALPADEGELARCAVRLGYGGPDRVVSREQFLADYRRHTSSIHRVFQTLVETPDRSPLLRAALRRIKAKAGRRARPRRSN